jgi:hypothetical protein
MSQDVTVQHNPEPVRLSIIIRYRQVSSRHREVPARRRAGSSGAGRERPGGPHHHGWGREAVAGRVQPPAAPPPCDAGTGPVRPARTAAPCAGRYHDQEPVNQDRSRGLSGRWQRSQDQLCGRGHSCGGGRQRAQLSSPGRSIGGSSAVNATIALSKETPRPLFPEVLLDGLLGGLGRGGGGLCQRKLKTDQLAASEI